MILAKLKKYFSLLFIQRIGDVLLQNEDEDILNVEGEIKPHRINDARQNKHKVLQ